MNKYQIHVDTAATSNVTTVTGSAGQASIYKMNGNPFQVTAILGNRHRAVRSVALKDAQIPVGFYNVRAPYNSFILNTTTYTLAPGNYNATTFINGLNALVTAGVGEFSIGPVSNKIQFVSASGSVTFAVAPLSLAALMGFTNGQVGASVTATNTYIINFDVYISIWIGEVGTASLDPSQITYKVPVTGGSGSILNYTEGSNWAQKVMFTDRSNRLDRLSVTVLDRFGNILNNNGLDWAFTLEIESAN
jgi:hypothetical protein